MSEVFVELPPGVYAQPRPSLALRTSDSSAWSPQQDASSPPPVSYGTEGEERAQGQRKNTGSTPPAGINVSVKISWIQVNSTVEVVRTAGVRDITFT